MMGIRNHILRWIQRDTLKYQSLHSDMLAARIGLTLDQYLWRSVKIALLAGTLFGILGYLVSTFISLEVASGRGIYNVFNIPFAAAVNIVVTAAAFKPLSIFISFIIGTYIVYALLLRFPAIEKKNRKMKINLTLHNAVAYMYAMRRGGAELLDTFYALSENASTYGEVALEFRQVVRDVDFFGYDVVTAINHLAEITPSEKLKDFLQNLLSVIESGGSMIDFLESSVRLYHDEARFEQKQFLNVLSMVAESYVTVFVAGPLFLIVIMVVMGLLGGPAVLELSFMVYAILPIGSAIFILLIDFISERVEKPERYIKVKPLNTYADVQILAKKGEEPLFEQLRKYDRIRNISNFIQHPFDSFASNVNLTFYVTVPIAIVYAIAAYLRIPHYEDPEVFIRVIDTHLIIALLIVLIPYAVFYQLWARKASGIQSMIPDFLERMAGINRVGLTIIQAIGIMVNTNLGILSYEIRRIKRDLDWGGNVTEALMRFEQRISTPAIARTVCLITKASEMSEQIGEVLSIAASDAKMSETLKRERRTEMFIYTAIVYLSFLVFLFVVAVLSTQFLPVLTQINTSGLPVTGSLAGIGTLPTSTINRLLYHACLIQAFFSGLIAGQMGESSLSAGVKHSCILLIISVVVFNFIIA